MRTVRPIVLIAACLAAALLPASGRAQSKESRVPSAVLGGMAGVAGGGYITLSLLVAQARAGHYMHDFEDVLGWRSTPVVAGAVTGVALGLLDPERLYRTVIGGAAGTALGIGAGLVAGGLFWDPPEGRWAGAAIGAGAGLALGGLAGMLWPEGGGEAAAASQAVRIPVGIALRW